jgi:hypothetical protein
MEEKNMSQIIDKVYKHPFITCMLISSVCGSIAALVSAFRKD